MIKKSDIRAGAYFFTRRQNVCISERDGDRVFVIWSDDNGDSCGDEIDIDELYQEIKTWNKEEE